ncbi:xanthine dehydrogenase family protein molybdopterin-binding subunit [Spongiactinospora rosea]|uniref:Xanthine dehydrogenase family protein molybdopterin-binding subunit n=1 Tax=Spongiactinospora rosea TaxID=2248750 RepID=A0A366LNG2_9ACTN|nr:xanthine dehydrogenase family protein molybdopterin-binding subunit [Spongiactinospora rosea]RBQ15458.1 xanthine dehydrogenase family protein molybdopterin-binding subunit [Spongiactinospora rosea]
MSAPAVGRAVSRVEALAKVTGTARYAADTEVAGVTHAVLVKSTIARGRITGIDTAKATGAPGVLGVFTHQNMPRLTVPGPEATFLKGFLPVQDDVVRYSGQPVAIVVAGTLEQARYAATLVKAAYDAETPQVSPAANMDLAYLPEPHPLFGPPVYTRGDVAAGLESADVKVAAEYATPLQHHNAMEPTAMVAAWDGDRLTAHVSTQGVGDVQRSLMAAFKLPAEGVRVICPYLGGGFGGKAMSWPEPILVAAVARQVRRPVKLVLTRADTYTASGHRAETRHSLRIGATKDGRLTAIDHTLTQQVSRSDELMFNNPGQTRVIYACPNVRTTQRAVRLDLPIANFTRSPEASGGHALESALDELAYALNIDPVELRLRNWSATNQETGHPHGSNHLRECYRRGAQRFGWARRDPRPGSMRDRDGLVGWGMATAAHASGGVPGAGADLVIRQDGTARIRSATQDVGTGTYTVMTQIGADGLGLPLRGVEFALGDSTFPRSVVAAASTTVPSVGEAVARVAAQGRDRLIALAVADPKSPLHGLDPGRVTARDGHLFDSERPSRRIAHREVMRRHGRPIEITAAPAAFTPRRYSVGAYFAEVHVDPGVGRIRLRRVVGVFDPGRVINPKTARSQVIGGAIWCAGIALTEHTLVDPHLGRVLTPNLSGYLLPVNADIPDIEVDFIDRPDPSSPALGARGFGEVPSTGLTAAIGNAVYHATGVRVRDLPITPEKIIKA